ncbi:FHA domain-containing protein [Micropruina sp.]|uniref:FHA domain-containing protein n=1 Tax=Micropruina sp. TaxID=2737536 RepID=UPI0039E28884
MAICPAGHTSKADDYCDLCGLPVTQGTDAASPAAAAPVQPLPGALCPHCGTNNAPDALFCEACGYDFTTGTMPRSATPTAEVPPAQWSSLPTPEGDADRWTSLPGSEAVQEGDQAGDRWSSLSRSGDAEDSEAEQGAPDPRWSSLSGPQEADEAESQDVQPDPSSPDAPSPEAQQAQPEAGQPGVAGPEQPADTSPDVPGPAASPAEFPAAVSPAAPTAGSESAPAEPPVPTPPSRRPLQARPTSVEWVAEIWIDPDWYATQGATDALPSPGLPEVVPLRASSALIGRTSRSRNIHPDIDCALDSGVSRRHAQVTSDGTRWWIEDLESANGTFLGSSAGPLPTTPIGRGRIEFAPDQRIYLGGWTRIVIRAATDDEKQAFNA